MRHNLTSNDPNLVYFTIQWGFAHFSHLRSRILLSTAWLQSCKVYPSNASSPVSLNQPVDPFLVRTKMLNFFKKFDKNRDGNDEIIMQQRRQRDTRGLRYRHSEPTLNISREPQVNQRSTHNSLKISWTFGPSIYRHFSPFISLHCQMCQLNV